MAEEIYSGKKKAKSGVINRLKKEKISLPARGYYRHGDIGSGVKKPQKYLKEKGFYDGKIDGEFGKQTLKAVKKFQTIHKLAIDGLFRKMCRKAM